MERVLEANNMHDELKKLRKRHNQEIRKKRDIDPRERSVSQPSFAETSCSP